MEAHQEQQEEQEQEQEEVEDEARQGLVDEAAVWRSICKYL